MIFSDTSALVRCHEPAAKDHARARNMLLREKHVACGLIQVEAVSTVVRRPGKDWRLRLHGRLDPCDRADAPVRRPARELCGCLTRRPLRAFGLAGGGERGPG